MVLLYHIAAIFVKEAGLNVTLSRKF